MSVRRLAPDHVQPNDFAFSRANAAWAKRKLKDYPKGRQASAVIPLLMRAQEQDGWVTKAAIEHIADMLDMPLIRVMEVATFYTQFQLQPVGEKAHFQVCGTTPCMLRGADDLKAICRSRMGEQFELTADGALSWEEVECQGACVNAPMIVVGKDTYEDLSPERFEAIIDAFEAGAGENVPTGPQIERHYSAPEGGLTSLTTDPTTSKGAKANGKADPQEATEAARPDTHAPLSNPAVKTPEKRSTAEKAENKAEKQDANITGANARRTRAGKPSEIKPMAKVVAAKQSMDETGRPVPMEKPAEPDDLKLIAGVGPKIEGVLNGLGIWTFGQIAAWDDQTVSWVDGYLRFRGRITRDDWVRQADALARGGEEEYVRVFGKKPR